MSKRIGVITPVSHLSGIMEILRSKGTVFILENGDKKEVREFILKNNIDALFCNPNAQNYKIDKELLEGTRVNLVNTCSTGHNHIDLEYINNQKIDFYSLKTDFELLNNLPSTSELALTLMMSLLRQLIPSTLSVKNYEWNYSNFVGRMASELTLGIVGYGRLGKIMAKYGQALCNRVVVYDPFVKSDRYENVTLEELAAISDVVSLHVHVKDDTKYMVNEKLLGRMKKCPYIINTSRGEIVNEVDIVRALKNNIIAGYGTDVIEDEFGDIKNSPIIRAMNQGYNIITTPHTGGMTIEGQTMAYKWAVNKF